MDPTKKIVKKPPPPLYESSDDDENSSLEGDEDENFQPSTTRTLALEAPRQSTLFNRLQLSTNLNTPPTNWLRSTPFVPSGIEHLEGDIISRIFSRKHGPQALMITLLLLVLLFHL
jgi:hypothetical protein